MDELRRVMFAALLAVSLLATSTARAAYSPAGSEFQVNSSTFLYQYRPAVAAGADGGFVVVWMSYAQDGSNLGIFGQRFASNGSEVGSEFQVSSYTFLFQSNPAVAADADGDFVVAWQSLQDPGYGIFAQRFASGGAPVGSEFRVNSYTPYNQRSADVAADPGGSFVVVWQSYADGSDYGVFGQRFDSDGTALGSEFQINTYTLYRQLNPSVAVKNDGGFVVVWTSPHDGSDYGVFGQRFASTGAPSGTEFQVNSYTPFGGIYADVAVDADGDFAVVWENFQDGSSFAAMGRLFDSSGAPSGSEFVVNTYTFIDQRRPAVAMDADGDFAVTWMSYFQDGYDWGQFVQRFDSAGNRDGGELQVNTYTANLQLAYVGKNIASAAGGDFVVVWQSLNQDGSGYGIFGQRFAVTENSPTPTPTPTDTPVPPTDTPTLTPTATPIGACPLTVDGDCTSGFEKGALLVKQDVAGNEKLVAKMVKGPALAQAALGNPLDPGGTVYSLCVYDDAGNLAGGVGASVVVDRAGDDCGGVPCWSAVGADPPDGKGYKYKDSALVADGVLKLLYKGGDPGKSKAIVKGKGPNIPSGIPAALQATTSATVQLRASDGICLSVTVDDIKKQQPASFKAKL